MNKKMEELMNNRVVAIITFVALAFGGGNLATVTNSESEVKQHVIDSLNKEMKSLSKEIEVVKGDMKVMKEVVTRVESDAKERSKEAKEQLNSMQQKQDEIKTLILTLKK